MIRQTVVPAPNLGLKFFLGEKKNTTLEIFTHEVRDAHLAVLSNHVIPNYAHIHISRP
jgi:hypothetical protein